MLGLGLMRAPRSCIAEGLFQSVGYTTVDSGTSGSWGSLGGIFIVYFIHQSTSRKKHTISKEKLNLKRIRRLRGVNGQHRSAPLRVAKTLGLLNIQNIKF